MFTNLEEQIMALVGIPPIFGLVFTFSIPRYKILGVCSQGRLQVVRVSGFSSSLSSIFLLWDYINSPSFFSTSVSLVWISTSNTLLGPSCASFLDIYLPIF